MSILKRLKTKFKELIKTPLLLLILFLKVGITIGIFYSFYWMGWKGMLGVIIGMSIMVIVLFTNNPIALMFIRMFQGKISLYKIMKGEMPNDAAPEDEKEEYIEVKRR